MQKAVEHGHFFGRKLLPSDSYIPTIQDIQKRCDWPVVMDIDPLLGSQVNMHIKYLLSLNLSHVLDVDVM